jgi:DNA mismatch repair protein MutS
MMQQYRSLKERHRDAVLFFRLGDFYEMFESDAAEVSSILGLTLTKRNGMPMCGIPYHASGTYIPRLLRAGKKVAICEQVSRPGEGKGIVQRDIVEVITPGTVVDEDYLERERNNYLAALGKIDGGCSFSYIDLSTGEFSATFLKDEQLYLGVSKELSRIEPSELLIQESFFEEEAAFSTMMSEKPKVLINRYPDWSFDIEESRRKLQEIFGVSNLKGFGIGDYEPALLSCGVLLDYLKDTAHGNIHHISTITIYGEEDFLGLDESTQRNLEITSNMRDGSGVFTLFSVLNKSRTAAGARMLRKSVLHPLRRKEEIEDRLERVETLYRKQMLLSNLRKSLSKVLDIERLSARIALGKAHPKDLVATGSAIGAALEVDKDLASWEFSSTWLLQDEERGAAKTLQKELLKALKEDPSVLLTEGNIIRDGFNDDLDRLRSMKRDSKEILDSYLEEEKRSSGISNLRIKYNKIIGHYLEVTKANLSLVPEHFIRRQSLVNAERYTTTRLGELEQELNSASERIVSLEKELFLQLRQVCKKEIPLLKRIGSYIAETDFFQSLAYAATVHGYVRPSISQEKGISITEGRHPVVEAGIQAGDFIPNSLELGKKGSFALITGPNMAGKSTFLRQNALIVLMAQTGSFVPALEANIGIIDRIFCRVGASDNLARGESTFLVEMNETSFILRTATERSLVIMDEVGRGTGTSDGLSIAWAVSEELIDRKIQTLFATHFHELSALERDTIIKLQLSVKEEGKEIIFLKQVSPGSAEGSYGIHVAGLAGVPERVIHRAEEILSTLEGRVEKQFHQPPPLSAPPLSDNLFSESELIQSELSGLKLDDFSPKKALDLLYNWKKRLNQG